MSTKYVSPTGNNGNTGNGPADAQAYQTLTFALTQISGSDEILMLAGTYVEGINDNVPSGSSGAYTRIGNYNGQSVTLRPASGEVCEFRSTQHHIELDGINLDGTNSTNRVIELGSSTHHLRFENLSVTTSTGPSYAVIMAEGTDHEFRNGYSTGGGRSGAGLAGTAYGIYIPGSRILVDGWEFDNVSGLAAHIYDSNGTPTGNIIRNCRIHRITRSGDYRMGGILIGGANNQIYNNLFYDNGTGASQGNAAITVGGSGNQVLNNTIANNLLIGIRINADAVNCQVRNNLIAFNSVNTIQNNGTNSQISNNWTSGDPLFVSVAADDYRLQPNSPALGLGVSLEDVPDDIDEAPRPEPPAPTTPGAHQDPAPTGDTPPNIVIASDPTIITFSDHDMQCPGNWENGFKQGRVIRFGDGERTASDWWTGEWKGSTFDLEVSDYDRFFREALLDNQSRYWVEPQEIKMTTRANRAVLGIPYTVFVGPIIGIKPTRPLAFNITLGDIVSQGMLSDRFQIPTRLIRDGMLWTLLQIAEGLDLEQPEPIIYGQHRRIPDVDPASPQGFEWTPIYLGLKEVNALLYHVWMVAGHAVADIPDVNTVDSEGVHQTVIGDPDWLIPYQANYVAAFGANYEDIRSSAFENDRRYTFIYGKAGLLEPTAADACATGELTLTCFVDGIEENGDGSGLVIVKRLKQYKHFAINFLAHRGPDSYQSGPWLTNPTWDLFDSAVEIVDEDSWDAADAIGDMRLPLPEGSPVPDYEAGYIGAAILGKTASDRATAGKWIADWNRSCGVRFGITHLGQMRVGMLSPTDAIKAAAPLYTDAYEILDQSFDVDVLWEDKVNRVPWRADYEHISGQWKTSDVVSLDDMVTAYGGEILGEIREYPFAPGETAANHLARLEVLTRRHPLRVFRSEQTIGPDHLGDSAGYRELFDYIRYKHFAGVNNNKSEIRLAWITRMQVQAGKRRVLFEAVDVEDLIGYDLPEGAADISGSPINDRCASAIEITPAETVNYSITIDTTENRTDPSVDLTACIGSPGDAYHAAWWTFSPSQDQKGHVTTGLSNYDTVLSIYTGLCGALTEHSCNDNDGVFETSFIEFTGAGDMIFLTGTTYKILVSGHGSPDFGNLVFTLFAEPL